MTKRVWLSAVVFCGLCCLIPGAGAAQIALPALITDSTTLQAAPGDEFLVRLTTIVPGAVATVVPGTVIKFATPGSQLNVQGTLIAVGTPEGQIFFTSNRENPQPGDWQDLVVNDPTGGTTFVNCVFQFGGGDITLAHPEARVMLRVQPFPAVIEDCTFERAFGSGAGFEGLGVQEFVRCTFRQNLYGGVAALHTRVTGIRLVDCLVTGNFIALMGVWNEFDMPGTVFTGNVYNAVVGANVEVGGGQVVRLTSPPSHLGLSTIIDGSLVVLSDGVLEVAPRANILFSPGARIAVNGTFRTAAVGEGGPVGPNESAFAHFTSQPAFRLPTRPDALGKAGLPDDALAALAARLPQSDAALNPADAWEGIQFFRDADDAGSIVQNLWIDRARTGIMMREASVRVTGCTVSNSFSSALRLSTASYPEIDQTWILNSALDGIVCEEDSGPNLYRNVVSDCFRTGVVISDIAMPVLVENVIIRSQDGIRIEGTSAPVIGNVQNVPTFDDGRNVIVNHSRYALANYTKNRIMAQNTFWGTQNLADIDRIVFDDDENAAYGEVVFLPPLGVNPTPTTTPVVTVIPTPTPFALEPTPTPTPPIAQTIGGVLNSDLVVSGVVYVATDLVVRGLAALTFEAGTIVRVEGKFSTVTGGAPPVSIRAEGGGRIYILGERDRPVVFTTDADKRWSGISIIGPETLTSDVNYAHIQRAEIGLTLADTEVRIERCRFQYCGIGVAVGRQAVSLYPTLRDNIFMENLIGVYAAGPARPDLGAGDDPGGNVFYLDTLRDLDLTGSTANLKAEGNYWTTAGPDGGVLRLDDPVDVMSQRIADVSGVSSADVVPLGQIVVGELEGRDVVWVGQVYLGEAQTVPRLAILPSGEHVDERAVAVDKVSRLEILPGTVIEVEPRKNIVLLLEGRLDAMGTPARPIIFRSSGELRGPTDWRGIRLISGGIESDPTLLRYVEIRDAYTGFSSILRSPRLEHVTVRNFSDQGMLISSWGQYDRKTGVLDLREGVGNPFAIARPQITDCDVRGGDFGLVSLDAEPNVTRSILIASVVSSVYVKGGHVPNLGNVEDGDTENDGANVIGGSIRYEVQNLSATAMSAQNNFWGNIASDSVVDSRIYDDDERFYSGAVRFVPRMVEAPPFFSVAGDLAGDGKVDGADLAAFAESWHKVLGDPEYRRELDLDGDYQIDRRDLLHLSNGLVR